MKNEVTGIRYVGLSVAETIIYYAKQVVTCLLFK